MFIFWQDIQNSSPKPDGQLLRNCIGTLLDMGYPEVFQCNFEAIGHPVSEKKTLIYSTGGVAIFFYFLRFFFMFKLFLTSSLERNIKFPVLVGRVYDPGLLRRIWLPYGFEYTCSQWWRDDLFKKGSDSLLRKSQQIQEINVHILGSLHTGKSHSPPCILV